MNDFVFDGFRIFFKHTDYHGCVHPYQYLEWTSYVREAFFQDTVPSFSQVLLRNISMMTTKIDAVFYGDTVFGDKLEAHLNVGRIKKVSFDMKIRFLNKLTRRKICETLHTVVFMDNATASFSRIPPEMQNVIVAYLDNSL
jgi:YbgC/YbaW family acyl-CoA thioester hydrolase